jgi:hypothetical protein
MADFWFGVMKMHGRRMYHNHVSSLEKTNKQIAAAFLVRARKVVSPAVLNDVWALYEEVEEDEQ